MNQNERMGLEERISCIEERLARLEDPDHGVSGTGFDKSTVLLDKATVLDILQISSSKLDELRKSGTLAAIPLKKGFAYRMADLADYVHLAKANSVNRYQCGLRLGLLLKGMDWAQKHKLQ